MGTGKSLGIQAKNSLRELTSGTGNILRRHTGTPGFVAPQGCQEDRASRATQFGVLWIAYNNRRKTSVRTSVKRWEIPATQKIPLREKKGRTIDYFLRRISARYTWRGEKKQRQGGNAGAHEDSAPHHRLSRRCESHPGRVKLSNESNWCN